MNPIFSLLVPTRERRLQVKRFLKSVVETTSNKSAIEILFAIDEEDNASALNVIECQNQYPELNINFYKRNRSEYLNKDYYNYLTQFAKGEYCWILGDDCVLTSPNWDILVKKRLDDYFSVKKDRIVCVSIKDNTPKPSPTLPPFPCFPLISKEAINLLGFALHPEVPTWGADYLIFQLYFKSSRLLVIDDNVFVNHISYHTTHDPRLEDLVNKRIGNIFNKTKGMPQHNIQRLEKEVLPKQIEKIKEYIIKKEQGV